MGVSYTASLIVGFEVRHSDFWTEKSVTNDFKSCPQGDRGEGRFCSHCGGKMDFHTRTWDEWTPNFESFIKQQEVEPEEIWPNDFDMFEALWNEVEIYKGLKLYSGDPKNFYTNPEVVILGKALTYTGDIGWHKHFENNFSLEDLSTAFQEVDQVAKEFGIQRPTKLYLTTSCG